MRSERASHVRRTAPPRRQFPSGYIRATWPLPPSQPAGSMIEVPPMPPRTSSRCASTRPGPARPSWGPLRRRRLPLLERSCRLRTPWRVWVGSSSVLVSSQLRGGAHRRRVAQPGWWSERVSGDAVCARFQRVWPHRGEANTYRGVSQCPLHVSVGVAGPPAAVWQLCALQGWRACGFCARRARACSVTRTRWSSVKCREW